MLNWPGTLEFGLQSVASINVSHNCVLCSAGQSRLFKFMGRNNCVHLHAQHAEALQ